MAGPNRRDAIGAVLAAAFFGGIAVKVFSVSDEPWPLVLGVLSPWVLLPTLALASILGRNVRLSSAVRAGLVLGWMAVAFVGGFALTAWLSDERPAVVLTVVGPLVLLLTVALVVILGDEVTLPTAVVSGVVAGFTMGTMFVLGILSPFALELGGRDLNEFGGDTGWPAPLIMGVIFMGAGGAVVGAVCGVAAWALHFALGQKPSDRELDTREADR